MMRAICNTRSVLRRNRGNCCGQFPAWNSWRSKDGDHFYDVGEGLGGVTVTATSTTGQAYTTTTWASGGYDLALPTGTYTVAFSGGGISPYSQQVSVGAGWHRSQRFTWLSCSTPVSVV